MPQFETVTVEILCEIIRQRTGQVQQSSKQFVQKKKKKTYTNSRQLKQKRGIQRQNTNPVKQVSETKASKKKKEENKRDSYQRDWSKPHSTQTK